MAEADVGRYGLRMIRVFRLPDEIPGSGLTGEVTIPLAAEGDNPLWISVYTEDGFQAWSSPVFAYRQDSKTGSQ